MVSIVLSGLWMVERFERMTISRTCEMKSVSLDDSRYKFLSIDRSRVLDDNNFIFCKD